MPLSSTCKRRLFRLTASTLAVGSLLGSVGCQVDVGGQTLPSPYYLYDDVQYFPSGPEFKLTREAEALEAASLEEARRRPYGSRRAASSRVRPDVEAIAPGEQEEAGTEEDMNGNGALGAEAEEAN